LSSAQFFIRCRILRGRFECPPELAHVGFNAVPCEHALSVHLRRLGVAHGHALASFSLGAAPTVAGSVALRLDNGAGDVQTNWVEAPDFDRAGAHDRVFVHDPDRGTLQSGNGLRAAVIPAGYQLYASFRFGGGVEGNIGAQQLTRVPNSPENAAIVPGLATLATSLVPVQRFAAEGGTPRESLAAAQARAFDAANAVNKAVTLEDVERLALATPGVPIARARAVANLEPVLPCYPAPGVITIIVIPPCPRRAPLPSRALLDAVERYLEPRRLVTSEIRAIAPRYRRLAVSAVVHLACEVDAKSVLDAAVKRLEAFFDPLEGGPDGTGWPFGRAVYRTEVMALLADTPGVARVTAFALQSGCGGGASGGQRCDNIELCAHELVLPGRHRLSVEAEVARDLRRSLEHECQ
jgi:predicted phage baseplate assembly protein